MPHHTPARLVHFLPLSVLYLFMMILGISSPVDVHAAWGKRSLDDFIEDAQKGDARDWAELGFVYLHGNDCAPQNLGEAHAWINKAVGAGHPLGLAALALANQDGLGVPRDRDKAQALFKQALPGLKKLAEKNDARALSALGLMAAQGYAMPKDEAKAFAWTEKAAQKASPGAMVRLAGYYRQGKGTEQDSKKALKWVKKAAGKGYSEGERQLGHVYYYGWLGEEQDYVKALQYYVDASEKGNAAAFVDIGYQYASGQGVEKDEARGVKNYHKAASLGSAHGMRRMGSAYKSGSGVQQDYAAAAKWFEKAMALHDGGAMVELGLMYERGQGVEKDKARALEFYLQAASEGVSTGMANAAWMYEHGAGTKRDYATAARWYRKAADKGHNRARVNLALMMHKGNGTPKDWPGALKLLKAAADGGYTRGKREYGVALTVWDGNGVSANPAQGLEYLKAAAEKGDVAGMYQLGRHYPNLQEGRKWLEKAAGKGSTDAMLFLDMVYRSDKDYKAACDILQKAVNAGAVLAYSGLAQCYAKGEGREKNLAMAEDLLRLGIESGQTDYPLFVDILRAQKRNTTGMSLLELEGDCTQPSALVHEKKKGHYFARIPACSPSLGQRKILAMDRDVEKHILDAAKAWEAGMPDIALAQLDTARERNPLVFYKLYPWLDLHLTAMPLEPYGRLLQDLEQDLGDTFGFWFSYTNAAALAGHPDLIRYGTQRMQATAKALETARERHMARVAMALYPAYALMLEGEKDAGYTELYNAVSGLEAADKLDIARYSTFMFPLLRQDVKKFNFVLDQNPTGKILASVQNPPVPFVDLRTGRVVPPPLSPVSAKPRPGLVGQGADASASVAPAPAGGSTKKKNSVVLD